MIREIVIDENYQTVRLFDSIEKGDIYKVPYDKKRHNGIKLEASRRNRDLRLMGKLKNKMDVKYRVSATEYPGYTSRLMKLVGQGLIRAEKRTNKQNGKWFCNAWDVIKWAKLK